MPYGLWLGIMPKALYHRQWQEAEFYKAVFAGAEQVRWTLDVLASAHDLAPRYGLGAMDAIHVATVITAQVDELVSGEKPGKPMLQVEEINTISLR